MNEFIDLLNSAGAAFTALAGRMLVQSSLLIAVLIVLDLVLRGRVKAVVRYWIWLLVLVKLVLPPSLSSPTGLAYWLRDALPRMPKQAEVVAVQPQTRPFRMPVVVEGPQEAEIHESHDVPVYSARESMPSTDASVAPPAATIAAPPLPPLTWQAAALLAWAAVVIVMAVLLIQRALFVRGVVAQSSSASQAMADLLDECRRRIGVRNDVELRVSGLSMSPSVCGLRRPRILVPQSMLDQLDTAQWKSILLHELAHIKRGDLWVNFIQALLQIVYFFHPLLWVGNALIRRVREQAVDETVLAAMGEEAEDYPRTLLSVSKLAFGRPVLSLRLIGVVESKKALTSRIKHIVSRPFPKTARLGVLGLILVVVAAATLLPMANAAPQEADVEKTPARRVPQAANARGNEADQITPPAQPGEATKVIEGVVTDGLGRPRQCVYVAPRGADLWRGVMSDVEGRFRLENVQPEQKVWVAYSQASRLFGVFTLLQPLPSSPVHVVLNLGEADLDGRVVGGDGKALAGRKVEIIVTTRDGIRLPLDYQPETDACGCYSHSRVPSGDGLTVEARLADDGEDVHTAPVKVRAGQLFIEMPMLVAASEKIQPDFDQNVNADGMLHCGGCVVDEAGRPIANARVRLRFDMPGYMSTWIREAATDEQGHWRRALPPECMDLSVSFEHPEYYMTESRSRPAREELIGGAHVATMKRGLPLEGKIVDERGEPVANVLVCGSRPSSFTPSPYSQVIEDSGMTRTLRDGTFLIRGLSPGSRSITIYSDYYAPLVQTVDIQTGMAPVSMTLRHGRTYRGRVVDVRGEPIEGIRVGTDRWQMDNEQRWMSRLSTTDDRGVFALENLPEGQISLRFGKKGFLGFSKDLPEDLSRIDEAVMYEVPVFKGRVVDADTNGPIGEFEIVNGIRRDAGGPLDRSRYHRSTVQDANGAFTHLWSGYGISYPTSIAACIMIYAKGHLPSAPVVLELGRICEPLTIRLEKGTPIAGTIVQPDGSPAANAQVALVRTGEKAYVDRDQFSAASYAYQAEIMTTSGADGRFELPLAREQGLIVAVHPSGYAQIQSTDFTGGSEIRLTAWSRVEGAIDRSRVEEKEIEIALSTLRANTDRQVPSIQWLIGRMTPTGNTFAYDCVPNELVAVGRISRFEMHDGRYFVPQPGKTHTIQVGVPGRAVTGRIVPPSDASVAFADPRRVHAVAFRTDSAGEIPAGIAAVDEISFNWLWRDKENVYEASTAVRKRFIPTIAEDGSFTFAGLEPGTYEFVINAHASLGENVSCGRGVLEAVAVSRFTAPQNNETSPVRVPDISLRLLGYPTVGDLAPVFEAKTFGGETIKLADLRGKVVLLDFWATWCRPCVAQLPQVQQVYEAFAGDAKFAMVGLSLDWDTEQAKGFLAEKQLKWPQVSLGDMERSPVVKQYGIGGVPTAVLIDPEGRIISVGAGIEQLKEEIRTALAAAR